MKIVTVVGARPQFVKAAAVRRAIEAYNKQASLARRHRSKKAFQEVLVHTGQHYDYVMDGVFFDEFQLQKPDYHLGVGSGSHAKQTALMLERIEGVLQQEKPDAVMVYGDTNSTLAGALTATKLNIPVAHVEAGLRSFNRVMPEEINRLITDHLSTILFCPTQQSVQNLVQEGIKDGKQKVVKRVGDVMYDSILHYSTLADKKSTILRDLGLVSSGRASTSASRTPQSAFQTPNSKLPAWPAGKGTPNHSSSVSGALNAELRTPNYYLATLHRAENTDDPKRLKSILAALDEIGKDVPVILPLHPRTKKMMETYGLQLEEERVRLIEPVSYLDMITLSKHAKIILTDSGGVQKEAYWLKVPCVTLREETEWVETVQSGWNLLVGTDMKKIIEAARHWHGKKRPRKNGGLFGDGRASEKIVQTLLNHFD